MIHKLAALCLIITLVTIAFAQGDSTLMRALVEELRGIRHALNGLVAAEAIKPIDNDVTFGEDAFANGDATPSVVNQTSFRTANSTATTITGFDGGQLGQVINLRCADGTNSTTTIDAGLTATGMAIPLYAGDTLQWMWNGSTWKQIGGLVGMGRFVRVSPADAIGDWPAITTGVGFNDLNLGDDGVRKGASAFAGRIVWNTVDTQLYTYMRRKGDGTAAGNANRVATILTASAHSMSVICPLDNDAYAEVNHSNSGVSATAYVAYVDGYWI